MAIIRAVNLLGGKALLPLIIGLGAVAVVLIGATAVLRRKSVHHDASAPGLYGVTGRMGGGKSYFLTWMAWTALRRGRTVFATYELKGFITFADWKDRIDHLVPYSGPVLVEPSEVEGDGKGWHQIIQCPPNSMVIVDEAHGWWPSQSYRAPVEVTMWISTLRHRQITFFWATQWVDAVAKWLRALSFGIWECENFKAGHRYTLFHPRKINGKIGTRQYDARIYVRRSDEVMEMYDTFNSASHSVQWGGSDDSPRLTNLSTGHKEAPGTTKTALPTSFRSPF